ncbi:MAG: hypothetical protein RMJ88_02925 [Thermogemmata sp.]|nr:hypothetical protein [Thermogemmata sp.]
MFSLMLLVMNGLFFPVIQEAKPRLVVATLTFPGSSPAFRWRVVQVRGTPTQPNEQVVLESDQFDQPVELPGEGTYHVEIIPQGGLPVRLAEKLQLKRGQMVTLRPDERLGVVRIFGEGLPRPKQVVLTAPRDPGPGAKGHRPIQQVDKFRLNLLVPPGTYEMWLVPANGARPQRIAENIRVLAGKVVGVDD